MAKSSPLSQKLKTDLERSAELQNIRSGKICRYCEFNKTPSAYMIDCGKRKAVYFHDSTCGEFSREPGAGPHEGDEYDD